MTIMGYTGGYLFGQPFFFSITALLLISSKKLELLKISNASEQLCCYELIMTSLIRASVLLAKQN